MLKPSEKNHGELVLKPGAWVAIILTILGMAGGVATAWVSVQREVAVSSVRDAEQDRAIVEIRSRVSGYVGTVAEVVNLNSAVDKLAADASANWKEQRQVNREILDRLPRR